MGQPSLLNSSLSLLICYAIFTVWQALINAWVCFWAILSIIHSLASPSVVRGPAASASPGSLFGMQDLELHPMLSQLGPAINKIPRRFLRAEKFKKH